MKKLQVYVQKPWKVSDCASYKLLKENPPSGVKYVNMGGSNLIQNKSRLGINNFIKQLIKKSVKLLYPSMPNSHYTPNASDYDLIHCEHCLSKNNHPWICNMEYVGQFWASGEVPKHGKKRVLKLLKSPYCKKIITWTDWCANDIVREFPEIKDKIETVYPGIPKIKTKRVINKDNKIRLLFVSRRFYFKGGLYAVEVMDRITKKYNNVEAIVISDVPKEVLERYSGNKNIKFMGMVPQKKLFNEVYPKCDIFLYPSFTDTFGFAIIEAMGYGLPVISAGGHSRKELIENGKTGFVVENPFGDSISMEDLEDLKNSIVAKLVKNTETIISKKPLRKKMGENCRRLINNGKFSIEKRNLKIMKIYGGVLK